MSKTSKIERAIQSLEADIHVLEMAVARLKAERDEKPARVRKVKPAVAEKL